MEATEAIASVAPGLCLRALSKVPIEIYKFLIEVPFAKKEIALPLQVQSIRPGLLCVICSVYCCDSVINKQCRL